MRHGAVVEAVDAQGVTLAGGERVEGAAVIGADGIGSVVREHVCPGVRPRDTGYTVVRGIATHDIGSGVAFEAWGRGCSGRRRGAARRTVVLVLRGAERARRPSDPLGAVGAERWPEPTRAQLAATPAEAVLVNRILRLDPLPTWTRGTVALLGDAAHAMEPNLGQGAAQAIEDAESLLVALRGGGELADALAAYAAARQRRAGMFQLESSRFARVALSSAPARATWCCG